MNPVIVMARLLGVGATMHPLRHYLKHGSGKSLNDAILQGSWAVATEDGQCLIHDCHAHIHAGDLFLLNSEGYGYCLPSCATFRLEGRVLPKRPAWVREYKRLVKQMKIGVDVSCPSIRSCKSSLLPQVQ